MTRDEFALKWKDVRTTHLPDCEIETYELCTCGLRGLVAAQRRDEYLINKAEENARREVEYRRAERQRRFHKLLKIGAGFSVTAVVPWVGIPVMGVWWAGASLLWLVEAYAPIHSNPHLRGVDGYVKWLFW